MPLRRRGLRLHEELVPVTARWTDPKIRKATLAPYARESETKTMALLEESLADKTGRPISKEVMKQLQAAAPQMCRSFWITCKQSARNTPRTPRKNVSRYRPTREYSERLGCGLRGSGRWRCLRQRLEDALRKPADGIAQETEGRAFLLFAGLNR